MKIYKVLPIFILLIMLGIMTTMYNAIPEGKQNFAKVSESPNNSSEQVASLEGRYVFTSKQLMFLLGISAIMGGVVTYLVMNKILNMMYRRSFESFGEEMRRQYGLGQLSSSRRR